jgi:hypothetical protein
MKALIQTGSSLSACGHAQAGGRVSVPLKSDFLSIVSSEFDCVPAEKALFYTACTEKVLPVFQGTIPYGREKGDNAG